MTVYIDRNIELLFNLWYILYVLWSFDGIQSQCFTNIFQMCADTIQMILLWVWIQSTTETTRQRCWTISSRGSVELIVSSSKSINST